VTDFQMGLVVSVVGLTITFFALGIFIGVIVLLQKLFPPKPEVSEGADEDSQESVAVLSVTSDESDDELVAALATVAYFRSRRSGQLGASLLAGPGPFRTSRQ
jgi:hypothetical protein